MDYSWASKKSLLLLCGPWLNKFEIRKVYSKHISPFTKKFLNHLRQKICHCQASGLRSLWWKFVLCNIFWNGLGRWMFTTVPGYNKRHVTESFFRENSVDISLVTAWIDNQDCHEQGYDCHEQGYWEGCKMVLLCHKEEYINYIAKKKRIY